MSTQNKKQVVIVGGGFGGIKAALEASRNDDFVVTLISDKLDFRYNPTLYHAATGGLFAQSSIPVSRILEGGSITFKQGILKSLNRAKQTIQLEDGEVVSYDTLVLSLGVVTNYFGIKGLEKYTFGIKSIEAVREFKEHLHKQFRESGKPDLNYLIVGAGPTGIELAGALPQYLRKLAKHYNVKNPDINVKIIEAAPRLLPRSAEQISQAVEKELSKLGVELIIGKSVDGATSSSLMVGGEAIKTKTIVWTAGTANHPFFKENGFSLTERGKVEVDDHLLAEKNIYVIGDNANTPFSGLAQTALHDGQYVAHDLEAKKYGHDGAAYRPRVPASVIPVGKGWAAFEWKK